MLGDGDKAVEVLTLINPINRTATRRASHATRSNPMRVRRRLFDAASCRARRMVLVHRFGRLDLSRGAGKGAGLRKRGERLSSIPASPNIGRPSTSRSASLSTYEITVENPDGCQPRRAPCRTRR